MASAPTLLVTSTYYDLRQVRDDLRRSIEGDLGYRALLSEHHSFPIDPDATTVENCRRRVERDTDILVLVIGGRYGSVDHGTAKSITNLEYLAARAKGIPIFAFVDKAVLTLLPAWQTNPDADFRSSGIEDPRVFGFIKKVRDEDSVWVSAFEHAGDITMALRTQLAYMMHEGLGALGRLRLREVAKLGPVSGAALRFAFERPTAREHRFFAQVLIDSLAEHADLRRSHRYGVTLGAGARVVGVTAADWIQNEIENLKRLIRTVTTLFNEALQEAVGPPGVAGYPETLAFVARSLAKAHRELIGWWERVLQTNVPEQLERLRDEISRWSTNAIEHIEGCGPRILESIDRALATPVGGPERNIQIDLTFTLDAEPVMTELERLRRDGAFGSF